MSLELINSFATFGTFLVIAATAIAALVQLRHARGANLIQAFGEVQEVYQSTAFREAEHFVITDLSHHWKDPAFRYQLVTQAARTAENQVKIAKINFVGNFWEQVGLMVKRNLVEREMVLEMFCNNSVAAWNSLTPVTAAFRRRAGPMLWDNFEYFAVLSEDWTEAHPDGAYPRGVRRMKIDDEFLAADAAYAASIAAT